MPKRKIQTVKTTELKSLLGQVRELIFQNQHRIGQSVTGQFGSPSKSQTVPDQFSMTQSLTGQLLALDLGTTEHSTIGIVLCKKKKDALVKITLPKDANIHAKECQLYLPMKEELKMKLLEWVGEEK